MWEHLSQDFLDVDQEHSVSMRGASQGSQKITQILSYLAYVSTSFPVGSIHLQDGPSKSIMKSLLHWAAALGHVGEVEALVGSGLFVDLLDHSHRTPLHFAAKSGRSAVVEALLTAGANVEAADDTQRVSLHYAAENGHAAVVKLLIENGAMVDKADGLHRTAISYAAQGGYAVIVTALLAAGACTESYSQQGPLSVATWEGHTEVVCF